MTAAPRANAPRIIVKGYDGLPRIGDPRGPIALPPYDRDTIRGRRRDYRKAPS